MTQAADAVQRLNALWAQDFPLTHALGIKAVRFEEDSLHCTMPLSGNTNTHQTLFAGSLYSAQALTAWGVIWLALDQQNLSASIIHASAQIDFTATVTSDVALSCSFGNRRLVFDQLQENGKARFDLQTEIHQQQQLACRFSGNYAVRLG